MNTIVLQRVALLQLHDFQIGRSQLWPLRLSREEETFVHLV